MLSVLSNENYESKSLIEQKDGLILKVKQDLEVVLRSVKKSRELEQRKLYNDIIKRHTDINANITYDLKDRIYNLV